MWIIQICDVLSSLSPILLCMKIHIRGYVEPEEIQISHSHHQLEAE